MHKKVEIPYKFDERRKKAWLEEYRKGTSFTKTCKAIKVSRQTVYDKLIADSEFARLKNDIDHEVLEVVENSLLKRAKGFEYTEVRNEIEKGVLVKQVAIKKTVPPDVGALIFLLCNRLPERWKNTQSVEHSGRVEMDMLRFTEIIYETNKNNTNTTFEGSDRLAKEGSR